MAIETNGTPVVMAGNDGFGGGGMGFWGFLILAMFLFGMGNFGGNNAPAVVPMPSPGNGNLSAEMQRGFDNQNTMANQREILSAINGGTAQSVAATNQVFHDTVNYLGDKYTELQRDIANVQIAQANALANQNQCCGETKMVLADGFAQTNANIAQNKYDAAMNTAAINANATAIGQKILDKMSENENKALQNQVNRLELAQAMNGVVKYPLGMAYNAGPSPFCSCVNNGCCGYYG